MEDILQVLQRFNPLARPGNTPVTPSQPIGLFPNDPSGYAPGGFASSMDTSAGAVAPKAAYQPSFMDGLTGFTDDNGIQHNGWGGMALGAGSALMNGYLGMQQYGLAKDQLDESKRQFNTNFEAQRKTTNTRLRDRQAARYASNPNAYQSPSDYMKRNEV